MNQQPAPSYIDKLAKPGPRKLLACDGGGIRGIISVEILARIEKELRAASGKPGLVLADYFDYVAGIEHRRDHRNARGAGLQHGRSPRVLSQERR